MAQAAICTRESCTSQVRMGSTRLAAVPSVIGSSTVISRLACGRGQRRSKAGHRRLPRVRPVGTYRGPHARTRRALSEAPTWPHIRLRVRPVSGYDPWGAQGLVVSAGHYAPEKCNLGDGAVSTGFHQFHVRRRWSTLTMAMHPDRETCPWVLRDPAVSGRDAARGDGDVRQVPPPPD